MKRAFAGLILPLLIGGGLAWRAFRAPADGTAAAPESPWTDPGLDNDMLKAADVATGAQFARACTTCHAFGRNEVIEGKVGPNLFGIYGAPIARQAGYDYSEALLKLKDRRWTVEALDRWLRDPAEFAPGSLMTFSGLLDPQDRMDLIAYLMTVK